MSALARLIAEEIAARGPITVARFMELALAHPEHGYYATRDPLGVAGDFITAPEVSQMFGELVGLWAAVTWETMGRPAPFVLAELGPGRGTLMADALRAGAAQEGFAEAARLNLVETSPTLRARQEEKLAAYAPSWHARFRDLPPGPMILIANEFFDALPVRQFLRGRGAWRERLVTVAGNGAGFRFTEAATAARGIPLPEAAPEGAVMEWGEAGAHLAREIGARITAQGGAALIIDYGHAASLPGDTLQAVRGHAYADPLAAPGETDLTTHVDFARLAAAAREGGASAFGPVPQGAFLLMLGIAQRAEALARGKDEKRRAAVEAALKRLIAPSEMGTLFKVLALAGPDLGAPAGFEGLNPEDT